MDKLQSLWDFLKGKKSYIAATALLVYALIQGDKEAILIALGLLGLRHGLTTEINKLK